MNKLKLESILSSLLIYLLIVGIIFIVTLYSPQKHKAKNYTEQKSEIIEVALGGPTESKSRQLNKKSNTKEESKERKITKEKKPKKVRNNKNTQHAKVKKISHKKTKKVLKKDSKKRAAKKPDTKKLFNNIPKKYKTDTHSKSSSSASGNSGKSIHKVNKSNGVVNRYFAKIQSKLRGWPAQSNFAGEKVSVELTVYSSGLFTYRILRRSINPEFNQSLTRYLEQLKQFGFGPHSNPKPYKIVVDFIAKG